MQTVDTIETVAPATTVPAIPAETLERIETRAPRLSAAKVAGAEPSTVGEPRAWTSTGQVD